MLQLDTNACNTRPCTALLYVQHGEWTGLTKRIRKAFLPLVSDGVSSSCWGVF